MPTAQEILQNAETIGTQVLVDACISDAMAYAAVKFRLEQNFTILKVYKVPETEIRYVTAASATAGNAGPSGPVLPVPEQATWIIISKAP